jgi:hypothetical protein
MPSPPVVQPIGSRQMCMERRLERHPLPPRSLPGILDFDPTDVHAWSLHSKAAKVLIQRRCRSDLAIINLRRCQIAPMALRPWRVGSLSPISDCFLLFIASRPIIALGGTTTGGHDSVLYENGIVDGACRAKVCRAGGWERSRRLVALSTFLSSFIPPSDLHTHCFRCLPDS